MGGEDGKEEMYSQTEARAFEATRMALWTRIKQNETREWRSRAGQSLCYLTITALKMSCPKARPKTVSYKAVTRLQVPPNRQVARMRPKRT